MRLTFKKASLLTYACKKLYQPATIIHPFTTLNKLGVHLLTNMTLVRRTWTIPMVSVSRPVCNTRVSTLNKTILHQPFVSISLLSTETNPIDKSRTPAITVKFQKKGKSYIHRIPELTMIKIFARMPLHVAIISCLQRVVRTTGHEKHLECDSLEHFWEQTRQQVQNRIQTDWKFYPMPLDAHKYLL